MQALLIAVIAGLMACSPGAEKVRDGGMQIGDPAPHDAGDALDLIDGSARGEAGLDPDERLDASPPDDAAADEPLPVSDSDPLATAVDSWESLPIDGARCGNGTDTGVGVNRSTQSGDLVILMQGGGACWDGDSCFVKKASVHVEDV